MSSQVVYPQLFQENRMVTRLFQAFRTNHLEILFKVYKVFKFNKPGTADVSKRAKGSLDSVVATKKSNSAAGVVSKTRSSIDGEVSKTRSDAGDVS